MAASCVGAYVASAVVAVRMISVYAWGAGLDIEEFGGDVTEERVLREIAVHVFLVGNAIDPVAVGIAVDIAAGKRNVAPGIRRVDSFAIRAEGDETHHEVRI